MNIEVLKKLIGKPVSLRKKPNFGLTGIIKAVIGTTVEFETMQKVGFFEADDIFEVHEVTRIVDQELCSCCGRCWYRKTAYDSCPYNDCDCGKKEK